MAHGALAAHARDELGIIEPHRPRPVLAALVSAASFFVGAGFPLLTVLLAPKAALAAAVGAVTIVILALLGWIAAYIGGANPVIGAGRVVLWSALAMAITTGIGAALGTHAS